MCPELPLLEQLALGLLSSDEAAPLEEHLATCERCLQTLIERDPADTLVEALREAPRTAERRAAVEDDIQRLEAALAARPWGDLPWSSEIAHGSGRSPTAPDAATEGLPRRRSATGRPPVDAAAGSGDPRPTAGGSKQSAANHADADDTPPSGSVFSTVTPRPEARTQAGDEDEHYDFLAPAQSPDELGRLGNYRVLRVLGTGGMGVVFEAEDVQLKRHVALKAMKPGGAVSASSRKRFLREAQAAAAVEHDHIVPVYQVGEDRGVPFIAMPLLRGQTLADRMGKFQVQGSKFKVDSPKSNHESPKSEVQSPKSEGAEALPTFEVLRIGREIALGLAAAHRRGLIHRDIKPSNIWLEEETGRAKILDFGLARASDGGEQLTQAGATLGTPAYMSPEQASGDDADAQRPVQSRLRALPRRDRPSALYRPRRAFDDGGRDHVPSARPTRVEPGLARRFE